MTGNVAPLLCIRDLRVDIAGKRLLDIDELDVGRGEIVGLVGESGAGKSLMQAAVLGLLPGKPFTIDNYYSLQKDSVCTTPALIGLRINPRSVEAIVPTYLGDKRSRAQFTRYRASSRR